ncbi:MAG: amidohydrolase, partial [Paracoccaceae bacterium]
MNFYTRATTTVLSTALMLAACSPDTERADTIFLNGDILTMSTDHPAAEALGIVGDRIAAVGSEAEVMTLRSADTQIIDLQGRTLLPGFFQPHEHPSLTSVVFSWPDVSDQSVSTAEQVWAVIRDAVAGKQPGEWVFINGWSRIIPGLAAPSLAELDAIAPDNPLFVLQQIPYVAHVNSLALEQAGISRDSADPVGGMYGRDANGDLDGTLFEGPAIFPFLMNQSLPHTAKDYETFLRQELQRHAANGVTSFASMGLFLPPEVDIFPVYRKLSATGQFPRHFVYVAEFNLDNKMAGARPGEGTDYLRFGGVKFFFDGSLFSGTALLCEPYEFNDVVDAFHFKPGQNGATAWKDQQALKERLIQLHNDGWQLSAHVVGDCGAQRLIGLYD